jgi:hypothetical protein
LPSTASTWPSRGHEARCFATAISGYRNHMGTAGWTISVIAIVIVLAIAIRELGWRR